MTNDMTHGKLFPILIRFTIPLVLGNLLQLTYNAVDSIIVGRYVGKEALAAVGTSNPLLTLIILFVQGICGLSYAVLFLILSTIFLPVRCGLWGTVNPRFIFWPSALG